MKPSNFNTKMSCWRGAARNPCQPRRLPCPQAAAEGILRSVESLQQANRRVLDRLRPLYIQELGLQKSVQTMLQDAKAQAPGLQVTSDIDPALNEVDGLQSLTVYRVIQEAMTNVLRHSRASTVHVAAEISGRDVRVDGRGNGGERLASGTYFFRIVSAGDVTAGRLTIMK